MAAAPASTNSRGGSFSQGGGRFTGKKNICDTFKSRNIYIPHQATIEVGPDGISQKRLVLRKLEESVMTRYAILIQYRNVTDRRTDRRTDEKN